MLAPSIPRTQILGICVVFAAISMIAAAPLFFGCLIPSANLLAAGPLPPDEPPVSATPAKAPSLLVLQSPDGRFSIELSCTDEGGACVKLLDQSQLDASGKASRQCELTLSPAAGNLHLAGGDCAYGATSMNSYAGSTIGSTQGKKISTCYIVAHGQGADRTYESAFACYDLSSGPPSAANAALYVDSHVIGTLQLVRGKEHMRVQVPQKEPEPAGNFERQPKEAGAIEPKVDPLVYLD